MIFNSQESKNQLFNTIDAIPELSGGGLGYLDGKSCRVLRKSQHVSGFDTYVVLEETPYVPISDENSSPKPPPASRNVKSSHVRKELISAGLNCGSAVLAGAAATAGVAAAPVTGGASTFLTLVAGAAALASAAQCGISIGRVIIEIAEPGSTEEYFDNEDWYKWTSGILDAVNLAGIVAGSPGAYSSIAKIVKMRQVTGKGLVEIIRGLSRAERKILARELADASGKISNRQWKQLVRAGKLSKIFTQSAISKTVLEQLTGRVGDIMSLYGSAADGDISLIVHLIQE